MWQAALIALPGREAAQKNVKGIQRSSNQLPPVQVQSRAMVSMMTVSSPPHLKSTSSARDRHLPKFHLSEANRSQKGEEDLGS